MSQLEKFNYDDIINNFNYPGNNDEPLDVFCGVMTGYNYEMILPWVNSIEKSGFNGLKVIILYVAQSTTVQKLINRGWLVLCFEKLNQQNLVVYNESGNNYNPPNYLTGKKFHICVDRFYHLWFFLSKLPSHIKKRCRYLTSTDVRDIVFQSNPFTWLSENLDLNNTNKRIVAITESITYENETTFSAMNLTDCYGSTMFEYMKKNLIYNAGTMAGEFNTMVDLFLQIYMLSMGGNLKFLQPDQAAYNILLSLSPFKDITLFIKSEDGWAAQLGTCWPHKQFEGKIIEPFPILDNNTQLLCTSKNKPFVIVHQYDRIPQLAAMFYNKYSTI